MPPESTPAPKRRSVTRQQLLDAAVECIASQGLQQASLSAIAKAAGVTTGAVQYHFRSREELLLAVVNDFGDALAAEQPLALDDPTEPDLQHRVGAVIRRYWQLFKKPHYLAIINLWLNAKSQGQLYRGVIEQLSVFEIRFDREWLTRFADCPAPPEQIVALRHLALSTLRGLALSQSYVLDGQRLEHELKLLIDLLTNALANPALLSQR